MSRGGFADDKEAVGVQRAQLLRGAGRPVDHYAVDFGGGAETEMQAGVAGGLKTAVGADFVASWARIVLADAHLLLGDLDATERIIAEVKPNISRGFGEGALPMVLRIEAQADILRHQGKASKAQDLLLNALEIAREQHYRLDELRTALALARLWKSRGQHKQAFDLLAPVYDWFTEGRDTHDLVAAREVLKAAG